jgi:hypothetical protein
MKTAKARLCEPSAKFAPGKVILTVYGRIITLLLTIFDDLNQGEKTYEHRLSEQF